MDICKQLARNGLVHCDLNEFNLLVDLSGGVQNAAEDGEDEDAGDFYVRHSGDASVTTRGQLTVPFGQQHIGKQMDGTGEIITEEPKKPKVLLENGVDARPVVTLIDFPQMVSVRHPNAEELWQRDINCLKRFFVTKLKCDMNEEDWERLVPVWGDLIANVDEEEVYIGGGDEDDDEQDGDKSVLTISSNSCLASTKQLRLDHALQASGFSTEDAQRKSELAYFEPIEKSCNVVQEEESGDDAINEDGQNSTADKLKSEGDAYDGEISDKEDDDQEEEVQFYREEEDERSTSNFSTISRAESYAIAKAKAADRVRRQLADMKRAKKTRGAFKKKNSNKTYVKGKRGFKDDFM